MQVNWNTSYRYCVDDDMPDDEVAPTPSIPRSGEWSIDIKFRGYVIGTWIYDTRNGDWKCKTNASCLACDEPLYSFITIKDDVIIDNFGVVPVSEFDKCTIIGEIDQGFEKYENHQIPALECKTCKTHQSLIGFLCDLTGEEITKDDITKLF